MPNSVHSYSNQDRYHYHLTESLWCRGRAPAEVTGEMRSMRRLIVKARSTTEAGEKLDPATPDPSDWGDVRPGPLLTPQTTETLRGMGLMLREASLGVEAFQRFFLLHPCLEFRSGMLTRDSVPEQKTLRMRAEMGISYLPRPGALAGRTELPTVAEDKWDTSLIIRGSCGGSPLNVLSNGT